MEKENLLVDTIELSTYIEMADITQEHKRMCIDLLEGRELEATDTFFNSIYRLVNPVLFLLLGIRRMEKCIKEHNSMGDKMDQMIDLGFDIFMKAGVEGKRLSIIARRNDFYRVLRSAQAEKLLDDQFNLIKKRNAKFKLAAIVIQMHAHHYFKSKLNDVEIKEKHIIEFCQHMFNADLTNYFHRNANTEKARESKVFPEISKIELEKNHII